MSLHGRFRRANRHNRRMGPRVGDSLVPHGATAVEVYLPPRRPFWRLYWHDLLAVVSVAAATTALVVKAAGGSSKVVMIGPFYDTQVWLALGMLATLSAAAWAVSRVWMDGGPRASWSVVLGAIATTLAAASCFLFGLIVAVALLLTWDTSYEKFTAPGTTEHFVLRTDKTGGYTSYTVYRGGPWQYHQLYPLAAGSKSFGVDYGTTPPSLIYPNGSRQARIPVPDE